MNIRIKDCLIVSRPSKPDTPIDDDQLCSIAFLCGDDVTAKAADIADAGHVSLLQITGDTGARKTYTVQDGTSSFICLPEQHYCSCNPEFFCIHLLAVYLAHQTLQVQHTVVNRAKYLHILMSVTV
ncbi:hypothetical protein BDV3_007280 [Batrachochytrium dendrobatidis]|nr:Zinc finger SWIM domain-containing protein 7 [Batrachochytrium dendrobatidis]